MDLYLDFPFIVYYSISPGCLCAGEKEGANEQSNTIQTS